MGDVDTLLQPSGADPRIGVMLQDRYRIVRKLGEGGMGAVYEGEHVLIKRKVAIKCLHAHFATSPEIVARFHREALAATSIRHPNIVEVTDMGRFPDGAVFMVLEYLDGHDWGKLLEQTGPQSLGRVVHIMSQVCAALDAAHDKGIVHRDLKPENIFLVRHGSDPDFAKVLDFGISKIRGTENEADAPQSKGLTRTGTAMGTPYYMPPEQAMGKRDIDHRADIYALGVILFQVLTGQYPFDDESYPMLVVKICTQDAPPIEQFRPDLPQGVQDLVRRMLAKDPASRPSSCGEVREALEPFREQNAKPVVVTPPPGVLSGALTGPMAAAAMAPINPPSTPVASTPFAVSGPMPVPRSGPPSWAILGGGLVILAIGGGALAMTMGANSAHVPTAPVTVSAPPTTPEPTTPTVGPAIAAAGTGVTPTAAPIAPPVAPTAAATVRVQIQTTPIDSEVYLDDRRIPNPFDGDLPQSVEPRNLRVQHEGHVTKVQDLVLEFGQRVVITLDRGRGVEDRSTTSRRRAAAAGATAQGTGATPAAGANPPPTVAAPPPAAPTPPPAAPTPAAPDAPAAPEGGRRALKNPFGR